MKRADPSLTSLSRLTRSNFIRIIRQKLTWNRPGSIPGSHSEGAKFLKMAHTKRKLHRGKMILKLISSNIIVFTGISCYLFC